MKVIVDGLMTEYQRIGTTGTPVVLLLPGWMSPARNFAKLIDRLAKNYDVIALDFPGWPDSELSETAWNVADYSHFLTEFASKIKLREIFAIIGHSFGGRVMLKGLANEQLTAQKLVFMDVAGVKPPSSSRQKVIKTAAKISRILPKNFREKIGRKFASDDYKSLRNDPILRATFTKIVDEDLTDLMPKVRAKSLLIWGAKDQETPLSDAEVFAKNLPDSHLEIIENAGHYAFLDQPEKVAKLVEEFLQ